MAPRKDTMRIIRQDVGFSAKLGFGGQVATATAICEDQAPAFVAPMRTGLTSDVAPIAVPTEDTTSPNEPAITARHVDRGAAPEGKPTSKTSASIRPTAGSAARGQVVYVAVSLTARQAALAESWAAAARCSVHFLIRHVAQGLRDEVFDNWEQNGMPEVEEPRGARGKHPTSVTMTLRPEFAANLSDRHDPLGILGLARVMGPAFRARFDAAFDAALAKAKIRSGTEGDEK